MIDDRLELAELLEWFDFGTDEPIPFEVIEY